MCPASLRSSDSSDDVFFLSFQTQKLVQLRNIILLSVPWLQFFRQVDGSQRNPQFIVKVVFISPGFFSGSFWSGFQIFFLGMEPAWCRRGTLHCFIATEDSYKVSHWKQYPPGTQYVYSNLSSGWRGFWKMMNFHLNGVGRTVFEVEWNERRWNVRLQKFWNPVHLGIYRHVQSGCCVNLLQHAVLILQPPHKIAHSKPDPRAYSQTTHSFRRGLRLFWEPWMWQWRMEWGGLLRLAVTWLPCWPVRCPSATKWVPADCKLPSWERSHIPVDSFWVDDFSSLSPGGDIGIRTFRTLRYFMKRYMLGQVVTKARTPKGNNPLKTDRCFLLFWEGEGGNLLIMDPWFPCDGFAMRPPWFPHSKLCLRSFAIAREAIFQEKIDEAAEIYSEHFGDGDSQLKKWQQKSPFQDGQKLIARWFLNLERCNVNVWFFLNHSFQLQQE